MEKTSHFKPADILLPHNTDMSAWSVVACDQFTSEPRYWEQVREITKGKPSTFHIILPEIYLEGDTSSFVDTINREMNRYLDEGLFECYKNSFIYVERKLKNGKIRRGIVGAIDLEAYDYTPGVKAAVRATEGTVLERIPPRVKIRENALLEVPHVMLLIDDPEDKVFSKIPDASGLQKLYDFKLSQGGGNIAGYLIQHLDMAEIEFALSGLYLKEVMEKKYGSDAGNGFVFAVGDGNHSLATAKACYEKIKAESGAGAAENHPARYALCELVNLYDESLVFEAIHRVAFNLDIKDVIAEMDRRFTRAYDTTQESECATVLSGDKRVKYQVCGEGELAVAKLQEMLDSAFASVIVDYIHGEDVVESLCSASENVGFLLPAINKLALFPGVIKNGVLPRKTFSMGEANEKRYYTECRMIRP